MDNRQEEIVVAQAVVELTEANLTPTAHTPEWAAEVAYLCPDGATTPPDPPPIVQEFAAELAMEG